MGAYKFMQSLGRKKQSDVLRFITRVRCWEARQRSAIVRLSGPSRIEKARSLGYRAKQGYVIYRIRVKRGGRRRKVSKGKTFGKPRNQGVKEQKHAPSHRAIAEIRAGNHLKALRVLNSYWIFSDGSHKYFEVIMIDPSHPVIRNDAKINWICAPNKKRREARGLTRAGKKHRGQGGKGNGYKKNRGSRRAQWRRNNTLKLARYR
eukprot:TRINITY_DN78961_c0_g1_i1.p1 TRINITY_DN78961_c0_g1~~TRINITY_DN78961_c0_g1_i1.p1  ORF type:complete len:205 (-),score=34.78 TRINITY_DN78961_c0_g1_i1:44-658(-)